MLQKVKQFWLSFTKMASALFQMIFGRPQWQSPIWMQWTKKKLALGIERVATWSKANPGKAKKMGGGAVAVFVLIGAGTYYWIHRPRPDYVQVAVSAPAAMAFRADAKPEHLKVHFSRSVAPLELIGKVTKTTAKLSPEIEGTWTWTDGENLDFTPNQDWPVATTYKLKLNTKDIKNSILEDNTFSFESASFKVNYSSAAYYQHPENPKEKRVTATLNLSHPVNPETLKDKVTVELEGDSETLGKIPKTYSATLNYDKYFGTVMVTSDIIPMPLKDTKAIVRIAPGWSSKRGGNKIKDPVEITTNVPGMFSYFKISSANLSYITTESYELEQVLTVETTTEVTDKTFDASFDLFLLPVRKKDDHNLAWNLGEVDDAVLKSAKKLKLNRIESEHPQTKIHSFKVDLPADRYLFARVKKGVVSFHEYILAEEFRTTIAVDKYPEEVKILHSGALLSLSGDKKLSILTRGVKAFQVEVAHVLGDQLNHLVAQSTGSYENPEFLNPSDFNWNNIAEKNTEVIQVKGSKGGKPEFAALDINKYLAKSSEGRRGLFFVSVGPYDLDKKTPTNGERDRRFILVTDLGLIVKKLPDESYDVFIQSIHGGNPVSGAKIDVIGKNGIDILSKTTDEQGRVHFPPLKDFKAEKSPTAFVAHHGGDISFLPIYRYDRQLQYSRFDVDGVYTNGDEDRLRAVIFSDRGLYRPGESVHVAGIVRSMNWKTSLSGLPLKWVVQDPKGQNFFSENTTLNKEGLVELSFPTQESSFVGTYTASLRLIKFDQQEEELGTATVRVDEFVPDRLKITSGFSTPETAGWSSPEGLKAWVRVLNLFGHPAEGLNVQSKLSIRPALPRFTGYSDYRFTTQLTDKFYEEPLAESETNDKGEIELALDISKFAKGNYRLNLETEAFESSGGRSVLSSTSLMVSNEKYFVGYKSDADLSYLKMNATAKVDFVAIDANLKKVATESLTLHLIEKKWKSVLTKQDNGTYKYESVPSDQEINKQEFKIANSGSAFTLPTTAPGDYKLNLVNKDQVSVATLDFTVIGQSNVLGKIDRNAELKIKLDRSDYRAGDEIEMQIRAPYVGAGMITIEREKIYAVKWFKTTSNNSLQTIKIPQDLEGNAYINVTFLRDIGSKEIFMSPLSYGVVPFSVDLKKRSLDVVLDAPASVRPGEKLTFDVTTGKKGKLIVFAINEGILQVAKYQTPQPLKTFFQKRALEISTSQLLDLVLPEFKLVKELSNSGGDADASALARNLNPFRKKGKPPVAYWSGIFDMKEGKNSVSYAVPEEFNGSLRVIAVAVSEEAIGVARGDVLVRGDFIISPTVPPILTPGDEVVVGYSVFNNLKGSGPDATVHVEIEVGAGLEVIGDSKADLKIAEMKEAHSQLRVRAKDQLGSYPIVFHAGMGKSASRLGEEIAIRPLSPYRTQIWSGEFTEGPQSIAMDRQIYSELSDRHLSVSVLPVTLANGLITYLNHFPYGCTEQVVSKAMPTLVLGKNAAFKISAVDQEKSFKQVIATLRQRQTSDGGFGLYSSYDATATFPSLYAIHYLVEAKERGQAIPQDLWDLAQGFLRQQTNTTVRDVSTAKTTAYALYLLARMGQTVGNEVNTLWKELETAKLTESWKPSTGAAFLAAAEKIMQQDSLAEGHLAAVKWQDEDKNKWFFDSYEDPGVHNSLLAYLVARHFPARAVKQNNEAIQRLVQLVSSGHYNSLNSSLAILALDKISASTANANADTGAEIRATAIDGEGKSSTVALASGLIREGQVPLLAKKAELSGPKKLRLFYALAEGGFDRADSLKPVSQGIEILREYRTPGGTSAVESVKLGEELEVHLTVRSLKKETIENVAVIDLLPSGFEIVYDRSQTAFLKPLLEPNQNEEQKSWAFYKRTPLNRAWFYHLLIPRAQAQEEDDGSGVGREVDDSQYGELPPPPEGMAEGEDSEGRENAAALVRPSLALPGSDMSVQYEEPREDRMVLYATVTTSATKYVYKIKATNEGVFKTSPTFAEHLYDREIQALGPSGHLKVEAAK